MGQESKVVIYLHNRFFDPLIQDDDSKVKCNFYKFKRRELG